MCITITPDYYQLLIIIMNCYFCLDPSLYLCTISYIIILFGGLTEFEQKETCQKLNFFFCSIFSE